MMVIFVIFFLCKVKKDSLDYRKALNLVLFLE